MLNIAKAPFFAPGRRNQPVHWNRALSKAIASLGKYETEDWRRAMWLPKSLRGFYPKWNNKFSPGAGCTCCGGGAGCLNTCVGEIPAQFQVDIGTVGNGTCSDCASMLSGQSFIVDFFTNPDLPCWYTYTFPFLDICLPTSGNTELWLQLPDVSAVFIQVQLHDIDSSNDDILWFRGVGDGSIACTDISGLDIPFFSITGGVCTGTPTCTITAL
jgi:hypothetical protein